MFNYLKKTDYNSILAGFSELKGRLIITGINRNQRSMKMIKNTGKSLAFVLTTLLMLFWHVDASAQCNPKYTGSECVGAAISFTSNAPGYDTWAWDFGDSKGTSNQRDPSYTYGAPGTYDVKLKVTDSRGFLDPCEKTIQVVVKPSPIVKFQLLNNAQQCFKGNNFCYADSSLPAPGSQIVRATYLFSDGGLIEEINPALPYTFCYEIKDPKGGFFDVTVELEDANGCVTKIKYDSMIRVWPKMGVLLNSNAPTGCDSTLATITNVTYQNWLNDPTTTIGLKDVAQFIFDFGDGNKIIGDSVTNTQYWTGKNNDGKVEYWYKQNGTFNATLTVYSRFGCSETFTYKAAATNIKIDPVILADKDSACTSDPEVCFRLRDGAIPGASFIWWFGDPPSGNDNFSDDDWTPCHNYGGGPWMISLRIVVGPCDVTVFDTITKVGPSSTIEVPFVRVPQEEKYQCTIRDSIHFVNNSTFYHDDPNYNDEDSVVYEYINIAGVRKNKRTGLDSLLLFDKNGGYDAYKLTDTIKARGYVIWYDAGKDSLVVVYNGNTTYHEKSFYGLDGTKRYVFNYPPSNDQTAVPRVPSIRRKDHVLRIWTLGDQYAPQCTTDTYANKNVDLNCNFTIDSLPVHWYTPWEEIYRYYQRGQNYTRPVRQTRFSRNSRTCYQVNVYPDSIMVVPREINLFVPWDSTYTALIPYINDSNQAATDTFVVDAQTEYPEIIDSAHYRIYLWRPRTVYKGEVISTVIKDDQKFFVPSGVTVRVKDISKNPPTYEWVTGPKTVEWEVDKQFEIEEGDSIISLVRMEVTPEDTVPAQLSTVLVDTTINGIPTTIQRQVYVIDSAVHRQWFFENIAQCNTVVLWHKDTVHPLRCESSNTISLALIPPSAKGLEWESGIPCPIDGDKTQYFLTFSMAETKPGCTQQWFEVNYDSLTGPNNWIPYNSGGVLAPPPPGIPIPFVLPYDIVGAWGTSWVKGYTSGEIGSDPSKRPNGSFTIGLIIGNGPPRTNSNGDPIAPECTDTAWYSDMFRYMYLNADFEILVPNNDPLAICAGETAWFRFINPIQDSIEFLRWNWGYQDRLLGYFEEHKYFQDYNGPVNGRNDEDVDWSPSDNWLANTLVRYTIDDVFGIQPVDTIVKRIYRQWTVKANTERAGDIIKDAFEQLGLDIQDIPPEDVALYLGDGTFGCIDTTGISQYFTFSKVGITENTVEHGQYKYLYTNDAQTDSVIIEEVLHFRDSSIQGFDTLLAPYAITTGRGTQWEKNWKRGEYIPGCYKFTYQHPEVRETKYCDRSEFDTVWVNSNGPMIPGVFLNNTVGCEKSDAKLLNVGFLNQFKMIDDAVCKGMWHEIYDSIRYWQYGDDFDPLAYPIDPRKFWEDPTRYANNIETKAVDWDWNDSIVDFERSIRFSHIYDEPGEYTIAVAMKDSIGCRDTAFLSAMVTGIKANFEHNAQLLSCKNIVSFFDSTVVFDPCPVDSCDQPCDSIVWYEWDFGDGSRRSILKDPSHDYTSSGWFTVKLKVHSLLGCVDSIEKQIFVPGPQPEFAFSGNNPWGEDSIVICVGDSVTLENLSKEPIYDPDWIFYWGDSSSNNTYSTKDKNELVGHTYNTVGTYYLHLIQIDEIEGTNIRCSRLFPDTSTIDGKTPREIKVIVRPITPAGIEIVDTIVCPHDIVNYTTKSDSIYTRFTWDFGDTDTLTATYPDTTVQHSYSSPGTYNVRMIPDYDLDAGDFGPKCVDTATGRVIVQEVIADFEIDEEDKPEFCFENTSQNATKYFWTFEDADGTSTSSEENPCYNWGERIGEWEVCLVAENDLGCKDTTCKVINNNFIKKIIPYNVFTPDAEGDAFNKYFEIEVEGATEYEIKIYNRWGELVFESTDPDLHWDGTIMNEGLKECPEGTYFYIINYTLKNEEPNGGGEPISGTVTLIRD